jgi:hypothetical protein
MLMTLFLCNSLFAANRKTNFDASLLTSFTYNMTNKISDLNQSYGVSFTARNLYMIAETKFSLRSDFFQESFKSEEGSFSVAVDRKIFREWAILTNPVNSDFLVGTGIALGFSQSVVDTDIQGESFKSAGTLEPLWGLMIDGQYTVANALVSDLFIDVMIRKMFANNYTKGERNELDFGVGVKF